MRSSPRPRVLVVDDDPTFRAALVRLLVDLADVDPVHSGAAALGAVAETRYDLAIVDAHMHPMDGYELVQHLADTVPALPIIMATGLAPDEVRARLAAGGGTAVRDVLPKPLFRGDLLAAVRAHCRA